MFFFRGNVLKPKQVETYPMATASIDLQVQPGHSFRSQFLVRFSCVEFMRIRTIYLKIANNLDFFQELIDRRKISFLCVWMISNAAKFDVFDVKLAFDDSFYFRAFRMFHEFNKSHDFAN